MSKDDQQRATPEHCSRIWFDTEFIEDGRTIELLSIGAVRDDGACFYAEFQEADYMKANDWVAKNVLPKLIGGTALQPRQWIAESFRNFCGERPEFWAYYADYDWVALCQLYGRMVDLPKGWPMFCRDVKQLCVALGDPKLPENGGEHHALADAKWARQAWGFLTGEPHPSMSGICSPASVVSSESERITDAEAKRWGDRLNWIHLRYEVDGSGTESGDPLDVIEAEIKQAFAREGAEQVTAFSNEILHGDDRHRAWLRDAAQCFIDGRPLPEAPK